MASYLVGNYLPELDQAIQLAITIGHVASYSSCILMELEIKTEKPMHDQLLLNPYLN